MDELLMAIIKGYTPDWRNVCSIAELEKEYEIKYNGPGWYYGATDTALILPSYDENMVRLLIWNRAAVGIDDPLKAYKWITTAPIRMDKR